MKHMNWVQTEDYIEGLGQGLACSRSSLFLSLLVRMGYDPNTLYLSSCFLLFMPLFLFPHRMHDYAVGGL
jgi:hypothetical protein